MMIASRNSTIYPRLQEKTSHWEKVEKGWEEPPKDKNASNVRKAARALPASVAGAVLLGGGVAYHVGTKGYGIAKEAAKALIETPKIGRNLKVMTGALFPLAVAGAAVLAPCVGALVGLVGGFYLGAERGLDGAMKYGLHAVDLAGAGAKDTKESLIEEQTATLGEGQKALEVEVGAAAKGVSGGVVNGALLAAGTSLVSAAYVLPAMVKGEAELWSSKSTPLPFKLVGTPLLPVGVAAAACLGPAVAGLWGLGCGAKDSYEKGYGESLQHTQKTMGKIHDFVHKAVFK